MNMGPCGIVCTICRLVIHLFMAGIFLYLCLPVALAAGGIEVQDNYLAPDFPGAVTFHLSVSSQAIIDTIELEYGTDQITCGRASAKARPDFEPARQVNTSWTWNFRKSGAPPPGARLWWRWTVKDEAGTELAVAEQDFFLEDSRYQWQEIRSDELALFSAVTDEAVNLALWQAANEALELLESDIGARPVGLVKIYNYPTTRELRDAVVYTRNWTGALALSTYETVLVGVNHRNLEWGKRAIAHELAHIVVYQLTFNCLGDLPTWLNEGLAEYLEGDLSDYQQTYFTQAVANDTLLSLRGLSSSFPSSSQRADLAYAQSRQVVDFLIGTYGSEKMVDLLQAFKAGSSYDRALQEVYNLDTSGLDNEWRASLGLSWRQIMATSTPISLPTLTLYGARTPTSAVVSVPTLTPTSAALPTLTHTPTTVRTATPLPRPTVRPSSTPTLTPVTPVPDRDISALALILGAVVMAGLLTAILIWARRMH